MLQLQVIVFFLHFNLYTQICVLFNILPLSTGNLGKTANNSTKVKEGLFN